MRANALVYPKTDEVTSQFNLDSKNNMNWSFINDPISENVSDIKMKQENIK